MKPEQFKIKQLCLQISADLVRQRIENLRATGLEKENNAVHIYEQAVILEEYLKKKGFWKEKGKKNETRN